MHALAVAVAVAVGLGLGLGACGGAGPPAAGRPPAERPRLFLAGDGELWVVDVATAHVRRLALAQLAPGDPPVRILRRGDGLALWGYDVWWLDPRRPGRPPRRILRHGWFFLPSARPDRLWVALLDPRSPATVNRLRAVREISIDGRVTARDTRPPHGAWPQLAVRGGLLFASRGGGWYLWNPATRRVLRRWTDAELGLPGPAHGDLIASCPEPCTELRLTDARTGAQRRIAAPGGWLLRPADGAFSPSGGLLAVPAQRREQPRGRARLALVDAAGGSVRLVPGSTVAPGYVLARWSRTGADVFLTGGLHPRSRAIVAYRVADRRARRLHVRVGGFYDAAAY
jgi:hypothetical protein